MDIFWACVLVALGWSVGGIVGGVAGVGGGIIAIPLLSLFLPADEAILVSSITGTYATLHLAIAYRHGLSWPEVRDLVIGSVPGFVLGSLTLKIAPVFLLQLLVCAVIVVFLVMQIRAPQLRKGLPEHRLIGHAAGAVSGFVNGAVCMGGAPMGIYVLLKGWSPDRARANMTLFFAIASVGGLLTQTCAGLFDADLVIMGLAGISGCALGQVAGLHAGRRVDKVLFRRIVLVFLAMSAGILLMRGLSAF